MAATGKTPILLYGSTTPTNAPSAGNLTNSSDGCEIAINVADKNLFFKDSTNAVNTVPIRQSSSTSNGWLSSTDWNTFNNKQPAGTYVTSVTGTAPVISSGGTTPAISMAAASGSVNGYLTSTDWTTFNNKVSSQWVTSGSNIYYTTGTVNIGATDPSYALDVASQNTTAGFGYAMRLRTNATAGAASLQFTDNPVTAQLGIITCDTSGNLKFSSSGGQAMQLHASKGVSIGNTTDPGATNLSVTGTVSATSTGKGIDARNIRQFGDVNGTTGVVLPNASNANVSANDCFVGVSANTSYLLAKFTQNQSFRETAFWFQAFNSGDGGGMRTYVRAEGTMGAGPSTSANIGATWGYETYNPASQLSVSVYKNTSNGTVEIWLNVGTYGSGTVFVNFNYMTMDNAATVTWYGLRYPNPSSTGKTSVAAAFTTL